MEISEIDAMKIWLMNDHVTMKPAEFARALENGAFDDELDRRTRANLRRLGFVQV